MEYSYILAQLFAVCQLLIEGKNNLNDYLVSNIGLLHLFTKY